MSANFGELRPNHFHSGIDLKTQGRTGLPVYAMDGGYVSRVVVSPWGFGRAVYINHPSGLTTVDFNGAAPRAPCAEHVSAEAAIARAVTADFR